MFFLCISFYRKQHHGDEDVLVLLKLKGAQPSFVFAKGLLFAVGLLANTSGLNSPVLV